MPAMPRFIRIALLIPVLALAVAAEPSPAATPAVAATAPPAVFIEQAAKLAPPGTARADLITAFHRFVRDEIQQVATKYG